MSEYRQRLRFRLRASSDARQPLTSRAPDVEQLSDIAWQIRESEARYRDLLESQQDIIFRRGSDRKLTFVNAAFCRLFATRFDDAVGRPFAPDVRNGETPSPLDPASGLRHQRFSQEIETIAGPRWFDFEEYIVAPSAGPATETQLVGRDITDHRRQQYELAEARDAAETANRAKSRFLAAMSHEIRTPMNGIMGMTGLVKETELTAEQSTYVNAVETSARTLLALIDEILDFSKIEAGKLELEHRVFDVEECIQSVVELLASRAHEKNIDIAWAIDPSLPSRLNGDEGRVRQIALNLIGNAIKFTDTGGVVVRVERVSEAIPSSGAAHGSVRLALTVSDTGIGIPAERRRNLFSEFEQGDAAIHRSHGGTGLGLAISRRIARAMGGDIVVSPNASQGTTFTALMLIDIAADSEARRIHAGAFGDHHVLLVSSSATERTAIALTLEGALIPVETATLADAERLIAAAERAGVPFTSIVMATGIEPDGARSIMRSSAVGAICVVDPGERDTIEAFRQAGVAQYLIRPIRPSTLLRHFASADAIANGAAPAVVTPGDRPDIQSPTVARDAVYRVLLVEDNEINALLATRMLEKAGTIVTHVVNGLEAVQHVTQSIASGPYAFDLILMDLHMPVMDGFAAVAALRALPFEARLGGRTLPPIVALTANAFAEDRRRCLDAGMDDYLAKPFEPTELRALLARWCQPRAAA